MTKNEEKQLEKEFNKKYSKYIKKLEEKRFLRKKKLEMKEIKMSYRHKIGLTTTKLLSYYLFIIFNVVLGYALIAMWHFADLSYLGVIITDILGQLLIYAIYAIRAFKDTQAEEQVRLEREKLSTLPSSTTDKINSLLNKLEDLTGVDIPELISSDDEESDENYEEEQIDNENSE